MRSSHCDAAVGEETFACSLRGRLRRENAGVYPGDLAELEEVHGELVLARVLERKNLLVRPAVANVDQVVVVTAVEEPPVDLLYLDRLLVHLESKDIDAVICVNKCDIEKASGIERVRRIYQDAGYRAVVTSALTGDGLGSLAQAMTGKNVILAGASGVGKSRLLSSLLLTELLTSPLSRIRRGRHTTKGVTLYRAGPSGFVADTPGFSRLDVIDCGPHELAYSFREMSPLVPLCHFPRCLHKTEDPCEVRKALSEGRIGAERYGSYLTLLEECQIKERRKYE